MLAVGLPITVLFLLTVRTSYLVNYVNYDYTTEFIGYAHGAPGVKWALAEIEQIAKDSLFDGLGEAMRNIVPLSKTMREDVNLLREWARTRARPANLPEAQPTEIRKVKLA